MGTHMDKNAAFLICGALLATLFGAFVVSKTEPFTTVGVMLAFIGVIVFSKWIFALGLSFLVGGVGLWNVLTSGVSFLPDGYRTAFLLFLPTVSLPIYILRERDIRPIKKNIEYGFFLLLFGIYLIGHYSVIGSNQYGAQKLAGFLAIGVVSSILIVMLGCSKGSHAVLNKIPSLLYIICLWVAVTLLLHGTSSVRSTIEGQNPIWVARISGILTIVSGYWLILEQSLSRRRLKLVISIIGMVTGSIAVIMTGSRGPLVSSIVTLVMMSLLKKRSPSKRIVRLAAVVLVFGVFLVIGSELGVLDFFVRGSVGFLEERNALGRLYRYVTAINMWMESPLIGKGIGRFSEYYIGVDTKAYPHNFVLEILSELGLCGLAFVIVLLGRPLMSKERNIFWYLSFYACMYSMFSGDLLWNSELLVLGALLWVSTPAPVE